MGSIFTFLSEVKAELMKVVWPTRKQTINYTFAIIVFSLAMAVILGSADLGLLQLFAKLVTR
jgi:preprotein translocase subunit SecE